MRRAIALVAGAAALAAAVPATASAAPLVTARYAAPGGTSYTLLAGSALKGGKAVFTLRIDPPSGSGDPYAVQGPVTTQRIEVARGVKLMAGSGIACSGPGASAVYGTATREAARVVATLRGGRTLRLTRHKAPTAWHFGGWVLGGIAASRQPVTRVDAYAKGGERIARARFARPQGC